MCKTASQKLTILFRMANVLLGEQRKVIVVQSLENLEKSRNKIQVRENLEKSGNFTERARYNLEMILYYWKQYIFILKHPPVMHPSTFYGPLGGLWNSILMGEGYMRGVYTPFTIFYNSYSSRNEKDFLLVLLKLSQASIVKIFHFSDEQKVVSVVPKRGCTPPHKSRSVFFKHIGHGK